MKRIIKGAVYKQNDGTMYRMHHIDNNGLIYYSEAILKGNSADIDWGIIDCGIGLFGEHGDVLVSDKEKKYFEEVIASNKPN